MSRAVFEDVHGFNKRLDGFFPCPRLHDAGLTSDYALAHANTDKVTGLLDYLHDQRTTPERLAARLPYGAITLDIRDRNTAKVIKHLASNQDPAVIAQQLLQHRDCQQLKVWRPSTTDNQIYIGVFY